MDYNPVGWFEIPARDIERAQKFYESLLHIEMKRQDIPDYEMVWFPYDENAKGASGALMKGMGYEPYPGGPVIYFTCPDIDGTLERVPGLGGKVMLPKKDISEYGYIAWLEDSEGNTIALHTAKK